MPKTILSNLTMYPYANKKALSWSWESLEEFYTHLELLSQAGFNGVELVFGTGFLKGLDNPTLLKQAKEIRNRAYDLNLSLPSIRGGAFFWHTYASECKNKQQQALDYAASALDFLAEIGGEVCLIVPGNREEEPPYEKHWEKAVEMSRKMDILANERSLYIGLENVESGFPLSALEWEKFLQDIRNITSHDRIGMYLDVGDITWMNTNYPAEWFYKLTPYILQIHFKDAKRKGEQCTLLEGDVNWHAISEAMKDIKYQAWVALEAHTVPTHGVKEYFSLLVKAMEKIFSLSETQV